jgi:hypothetical protein
MEHWGRSRATPLFAALVLTVSLLFLCQVARSQTQTAAPAPAKLLKDFGYVGA